MKKVLIAVIICVCAFARPTAADNSAAAGKVTAPAADGQAAAVRKKVFMQVGAIEKIEGDKFLMRKVETRYEFYFNEDTKVFIRTEGSIDRINEKNYLVIKGPKNSKVVLANSIYVYDSRDEYDAVIDKKEQDQDAPQKVFSAMLEGTVRKKGPLIIILENGKDYTVSYDEDTYWVITKKSDKNEIKPGERIKLFFDRFYSIRHKNYPIKVIIDRVKAGF